MVAHIQTICEMPDFGGKADVLGIKLLERSVSWSAVASAVSRPNSSGAVTKRDKCIFTDRRVVPEFHTNRGIDFDHVSKKRGRGLRLLGSADQTSWGPGVCWIEGLIGRHHV